MEAVWSAFYSSMVACVTKKSKSVEETSHIYSRSLTDCLRAFFGLILKQIYHSQNSTPMGFIVSPLCLGCRRSNQELGHFESACTFSNICRQWPNILGSRLCVFFLMWDALCRGISTLRQRFLHCLKEKLEGDNGISVTVVTRTGYLFLFFDHVYVLYASALNLPRVTFYKCGQVVN